MSLSATLFGRDSAIFKATNILGLGIPGWLDRKFGAPETEGPRLSDLSVQTSTYGTAMPRLYGTIAVAGNITWLENNKLKETVTKNESGGKGGKGSGEPTTTFSYSATFHLSICQGPISGVIRIWCGDKLIYNAGSADVETVISSNKAAEKFRVYLGTDDQESDPRYEAQFGVGNVSAHRGEAYIAFYDFELEDFGNSLQGSQFKVEVIKNSTLEWQSIAVASGLPTSPAAALPKRAGQDSSGIVRYTTLESDILYRYAVNGDVLSRTIWLNTSGTPTFTLTAFNGQNNHCAYLSGSAQLLYIGNESFPVAVGSFTPVAAGKVGSAIVAIGNSEIAVGSTALGVDLGEGFALPFAFGDASYWAGSLYISTSNGSSGINIYRVDIDITGISPSVDFVLLGSVPGFPSQCVINDSGIITYNTNATTLFTTIKIYDISTLAEKSSSGLVTLSTQSARSATIADGVINFQRTSDARVQRIALLPSVASTTLDSVILAEASLSGLIDSSDIDVSGLSGNVRGYKITGGTIRASIEPLQAAFRFDVRQHGYKLEFIPRGQPVVANIGWEDLVPPGDEASGEILQESREMDSQLSARTTIKYLDSVREYSIAEQYSERLNTEAVNRSERELALVMTASEAAQAAEILNFLPWLERTGYAFSVPPSYRYLEPGDVITLQMPNAAYQLRLTDTNETTSGRIECKAVSNRAALYDSSATGSEGVPPSGSVPLAGESFFLPLDIPVVDETIQNAVGFVGVMTGFTSGWPGAMAVRSNDNGQTWTRLQGYSGKATIGLARDSLSASNGTMIDQSGILVDLVSGVLESKTKDQMLSGVNYAAYGANGRWEIVRFQNATLQVDGSYMVSGFVRGERGTEWATGLHAAGDYFVLLDDPDNAFIGSPVESLWLERLYRGVTLRASVDTAVDVPFAYNGVNLECLSPVYASGSRDGSSNFTGAFTRRSRLSSSWWTTGVVAPVGEVSEAYEIDVMNGSTVARTITASSPSFSYSAADQTTDFGSPQSSITFRFYQLSGTVGRGFPYEVTL